MKKNILHCLLFFCMGLFMACSEDEKTEDKRDANQVHISAIFPQELSATRGETDATHKLRCILELWSKDETPKLVYHGEVTADPTVKIEDLLFDFTLDNGTYSCLMWADYIDVLAVSEERIPTEGDTPFVYYADKYYNTADLKNITLREINSIMNNDACDAFFYSGELLKQAGALQQDITLVRPISKVTIKEKNMEEFTLLRELAVSFNIPSAFNVVSGEASVETVAVNYSHTNFDPAMSPNGAFFSAYIFANATNHKLGEVNLSLVTKRLPLQNIVIPDIIPLIRGQHVQVTGSMMGISPDPDTQFEITYDINVTDWAESNQEFAVTDVKPKVGDFFYKDGSFSSNYIKDGNNPCIGVVFAVAHDNGKASGDIPANYMVDGVSKLEKVRGWVVSTYDFRDGINDTKLQARKANITPPEGLKGDADDIQGFMKTELLKKETLSDYPIAELIVNYQSAEATKAPDNTSGWYWAAAKQYDVLAQEYATAKDGQLLESLAVRNSLMILADDGAGELFPEAGDERRYWYSTATDKRGKNIWAGFVSLGTGNKDYGSLEDDWWAVTNSGNARAILTF